MFISVDLYDPKPAYLQISDAVTRAIAIGALKTGDRLPAIREAATQARVNRNTVSRAYLELEHRGLVQARQGSGFYVSEDSAELEQARRRAELAQRIEQIVTEATLSGISAAQLTQLITARYDALEEESANE
jgi:GntR family transcriptional regulator